MSAEWIKFEKATHDKPEVWEIAEILQIDPDAVIGKLLRIWSWFDDQTEKGNAPSVTKSLLDRNVSVSGFCDAMISVGWMVEKKSEQNPIISEVILPNFSRHNGKTAKNRALTARRVANHKAKTNANSNATVNAEVTQPVTQNALPRKEKKRKEYKYTPQHVSMAESMANAIAKVAPKEKLPNLEQWADDIRKLNEIDNVPMADIERVFNWANQDDFWSTNILSPSKLRKQFGKLDAKCNVKPLSKSGVDFVGGHVVQ